MRKIKLYFHNSDTTAYGSILDKKNPTMADDMWDFLSEPKKCYSHHTISTGGDLLLKPLPPLHPVAMGNQSNPLGNDIPYLCDLKPGQICWRGTHFCVIHEPCTEPLTAGGPVLFEIDSEYMAEFKKGCKDLWYQTSLYHKLGIVTVSRKED